ncbi:uncharacterized protein LOC106768348 [Vigna radiata var. radiata]|uniref:Uncharacterized protein LOC106768348 n=1 Tax=Vigna radiata var. radiata TaxID=3916 RepID=A0A1S3USE3_VIGRR|nr:uncharacterized protein LOC106768348 [Vigna radiata var. radiata]
MEGIPVRSVIPSASTSHSHHLQRKTIIQLSSSSTTKLLTQNRCLRFSVRAKLSSTDFQDFRSYARPSHLLPASEVKVYTDTSVENISSLKEGGSKSLYRVKLCTSSLYGSSISDLNAGILLCLIDENGNSILQRIPVSLMMDHSTESGDITNIDMLHFQRGSADEFIFEGPKIARLEALWVSVESGQWRLGSVSLMVISCEGQPSGLEDGLQSYTGFQYDFQIDDVLLGEGTDLSMLELRPTLVTELEGNDLTNIFNKGLSDSTLLSNPKISKEDSMREYADLKFSLLFYDAMLTLFGTAVASFSAGENAGIDFLIGGVGGFLYLLLLQRSVDELPASELITSDKGRSDAFFRGIKGPIASVALALGLAVIATRYSSGDLQVMLTPKDLIFGMMGFLVCKISVLLAAFKPIALGSKLPTDM